MAWKEVGNNAIDIKKEIGKPIIGTYTGHKDIKTKIGDQVIWQFTDEDEQPFGVYGFTMLNRAMEAVKIGTLCRLTYRGTKNIKTKFGMKDVHQVLVEIDSDETEDAAEGKAEGDIPF